MTSRRLRTSGVAALSWTAMYRTSLLNSASSRLGSTSRNQVVSTTIASCCCKRLCTFGCCCFGVTAPPCPTRLRPFERVPLGVWRGVHGPSAHGDREREREIVGAEMRGFSKRRGSLFVCATSIPMRVSSFSFRERTAVTTYSSIQDPPLGQPTHTHTRNRPEGTGTDNPTGYRSQVEDYPFKRSMHSNVMDNCRIESCYIE